MTLADIWQGYVMDRSHMVIAARTALEIEAICQDHAASAPRPCDTEPEEEP